METKPRIETTYRLTYAERLRAAWELTLSVPASMLPLCFFPVMGAVLLWIASLPTSHNTGWDYVVVVGCFAFVPCMVLWNTYRAQRADRTKGPYHYCFDAEGVHVTTPISALTHRWPAILRARKTKGMLYLYFTKRCAHCIPLRVLPTSSAAQEIEQLAAAGGVPRVGT